MNRRISLFTPPTEFRVSKTAIRNGFTMVELLVVTGIVGLLIALALPAIAQARATAQRTACLNNLRNVNMAMIHVVESTGRFPASGNYTPEFGRHHSWVVDVLPWLDQANVAKRWNKDLPIEQEPNLSLSQLSFPALTCPSDSSLGGEGDLSYVVNGGVGFTVYRQGVHDCPIDASGKKLDLNGNGVACDAADIDGINLPDKELFKRVVLFFNETWNSEISQRHHTNASIVDGLSYTLSLSENVRTGYNPEFEGDPQHSSWSSPSNKLTSFHIGNPCEDGECSAGKVDYNRCNSGHFRINSGLDEAEGNSPIPNSFHRGGVNMGFVDGRVKFVNENIDGAVYSALTTPQGRLLNETLLQDVILGGSEF